VQAPWVDPNQIQGNLLLSVDVYVGTGLAIWGTAYDPEHEDPNTAATIGPITAELAPALAGVSLAYDDATNRYDIAWWPTVAQVGIHYLVLTVTEAGTAGPIRHETATYAVRILPPNRPPVILHGGCRIVSQ
jgi:hypothetical protein